jgi:hypothetical protein
MANVHLALLILAFLLFALSAAGIPSPPDPSRRWNLIAAGLAAYMLSLIFT